MRQGFKGMVGQGKPKAKANESGARFIQLMVVLLLLGLVIWAYAR